MGPQLLREEESLELHLANQGAWKWPHKSRTNRVQLSPLKSMGVTETTGHVC